jgi:undecaprenyl diphosphate synthase
LARVGKPIDEFSLSQELALAHVADPELLIRTGDEMRISNFILWQAAYTELYFSPSLWPDFNEAALDDAIRDFSGRERRFGKTSAQLSGQQSARLQTA